MGMDLGCRGCALRHLQALSPSQVGSPPVHTSDASFPIIAIAVIGILATGFLLVSYYIFVIKCCLNWHRIDVLRRFSLSQRRRDETLMAAFSVGVDTRGLDEAVIRSIPVVKFQKGGDSGERSFCDCAVCLNEFQEEEKLRIIPNCGHVFHIDCIDVWLQSNANCPLCRNSISCAPRGFPPRQIFAPTTTPQDPADHHTLAGDEDFVVIELGGAAATPSDASSDRSPSTLPRSITPSPRRKPEQKKPRKLHKGSSMGDECITSSRVKDEDDPFFIQPIRRSFSMDSSTDRQLLLAIQDIVQRNRAGASEVSPVEGHNSRVRRSFFSFGHGRSSRSAVLPVYLEP